MTQQTLTGETADSRDRPKTMLYCVECDGWILRRKRFDHPHDLVDPEESEDEDDDPEPERVGSMYEIELSYSVEFRFRIPAWSEQVAKERAEDLVDYPDNCADMFQVHSRDHEIEEILSDDPAIPEDWDQYGSTRLWEVYGLESDE